MAKAMKKQPPVATYSKHFLASLQRAGEHAARLGHGRLTREHLMLALLDDHDTSFLIKAYGVDQEAARDGLLKALKKRHGELAGDGVPEPTPGLYGVLEQAMASVARSGLPEVESNVVLALLLEDANSTAAKVLAPYGLDFAGVIQFLKLRSTTARHTAPKAASSSPAPSAKTSGGEAPSRAAAAPSSSPSPPAAPASAANKTAATPPPAASKNVTNRESAAAGREAAAGKADRGAQPPQQRREAASRNDRAQNPAPRDAAASGKPATRQATAPTLATPTAPATIHKPTQTPASAPPHKKGAHAGERPPQQRPGATTPAPNTPAAAAQHVPSMATTPREQAPPPGPPPSQRPERISSRNTPPPSPSPRTAQPSAAAASPSAPLRPHAAVAAPPARSSHRAEPPHQPPPSASPMPAPPRQPAPPPPPGEREVLSPTGSVLERGRFVENIPRRLRAHDCTPVEVRLTQPENAPLMANGPSSPQLIAEAITVQLRAPGKGLHIEGTTAETQWIRSGETSVGDGELAAWHWLVKARRPGKQRLKLSMTARTVNRNGQIQETHLPDTVILVHVTRNWRYLSMRAGLWLAVVAGSALLTWLVPRILASDRIRNVLHALGLL